jgi:hypothetical protein
VAVVRGAGSAADAVEALLPIYPDWKRLIATGRDVESLIGPFLAAVRARRRRES